jgi:DNA-binding response OmpR family regulator
VFSFRKNLQKEHFPISTIAYNKFKTETKFLIGISMKMFLLEDDNSLQKGIELKLTKEGHQVVCADTIASARQKINSVFDMAILDLNMPDGSGMDICRELREKSPTPHILILTSNDAETDIVMGYEMGADDYMTKPFSLSVLLSKINAVQRRIEQPLKTFIFDTTKQTVEIRGQTVSLTRNEWRLLYALWQNAGQTLTKEQLLEKLWDIDGEFVDENTLAVNIRRLREKIEENPSNPEIIENVRGIGYRVNKL